MRAASGYVALATLLAAAVALAAAGAAQRLYFYVPAARHGYPAWMQGLLAGLDLRLDARAGAFLLAVFFGCYLVVLACTDGISSRIAIAAIVALHAVFLLAPPLFSADVFGYIDYARLGVIHGLDPYVHGAAAAPADAVAPFVGWHDVPSPYGPLFTLASYALAHLSVPAALWMYKAATAAAGLGCVALVWRLAARSGAEPRRAAMLVGLNPLVVAYGVGGAHNDLLVELLVLGALACVVSGRDRAGGGLVALAALTKVSAGIVLPFLVVGARRRGHALAGALASSAAVVACGLAVLGPDLFGFAGQIVQQQRIVARTSVPSQLGMLLGQGGMTAAIRTACTIGLAAALLLALWRALQGADWVTCAGWATLAGLVSSAWLTPWYVVWLLPLAAVAPSTRLRVATLAFCTYIVTTRVGHYLL